MLKTYKELLEKRLAELQLGTFMKFCDEALDESPMTGIRAAFESVGLKPTTTAFRNETNALLAVMRPHIVAKIRKGIKKTVDAEIFDRRVEEFTSIHPTEVEEMLNCSTSERRRLVEQDHLVTGRIEDCKYGLVRYPSLISTARTLKNLDKIREKHKKEVALNRSKASKKASTKAVETRAKNKAIVDQNRAWLDELRGGDENNQLVFRILLIQAASRYAKNPKLANKENWYSLKNNGLSHLLNVMREQPEWLDGHIKEAFYRPENPNKYFRQLCDKHFDEYRDIRDSNYDYRVYEFCDDYANEISKCKHCVSEVTEDYYSLYYIDIKVGDYKFGFHTPFPMADQVGFSPVDEVEHVHHVEQEGAHRFGRAITDLETRYLPPELVKDELLALSATAKNTVAG